MKIKINKMTEVYQMTDEETDAGTMRLIKNM